MNAAGEILPELVDELHAYIVATKQHPVVIGHSLGGLLTLMLADKYPADVRKIVIVDSLPSLAALYKADATPDQVKAMAEGIKGQIVAMPADQFATMAPMMAAQMVKDPEGQKLVAAGSIASDRAVVAEAMSEDLLTDLRSEVAKIKTPALMLYPAGGAVAQVGGEDKVDALYHGQYKPMPNVTLVRVNDSRHFIMYDQPAKLDAAIEAFVK